MPYLATDRARRDALPPRDEDESAPGGLALTRRVGASLIVERACPKARQLGVRAGMTLGQAQAIAPELAALPSETHRDQALLRQLARWALRFSPAVEPVEPDTLLIDVTGCERLFAGEANIARQAVGGLLRQGFHARAAIAETVGAAQALAFAGDEPTVVVPNGQISAYLAPLPPLALRIDPRTGERLAAVGVRSIGDLLMLPRAALPARFGTQLVLRLQQALGEVFEGINGFAPENVPQAGAGFEGPVFDPRAIQSVVKKLLNDVFAQVLEQERALRRIDCAVYYENAPPALLSVGLSRASRSQTHVGELLARRLEEVDPSPGVSGLMLTAHETSLWKPEQAELFEEGFGVQGSGFGADAERDAEELGCLVDRIANRLGYAAVVRPVLLDDYQPEAAFRYVSVADAGLVPENVAAGVSPAVDARNAPAPPMRPLRLLPRPLPIRVIALLPDGPPTWFACRGREYVIVRAWGPERLETAWWRGADIRRDYFRAATETGEHFWIYHAAETGGWHLHGVFV